MSREKPFLPYGRQTIEADDVAAVAAALAGDMLTTGPTVGAFEQAFADAAGAVEAVACNSGTAALHLAMMALDLGPGAAVIVPTITFLATANAARMCGAEAVFADVDPETGLMTPETLREALARAQAQGVAAAGAAPVHLNGQLCDMAGLAEVAREAGIWLIEDACHAIGASGVGASPGSRIAAFSTHPVKGITTGEGGVATTNDLALAAKMRQLRSHGMTRDAEAFEVADLAFDGDEPNPWHYEMTELGWNYRIPDVLCALGLSQLAKLERLHARRAELAARYDRLLAPLAPLARPVPRGTRPDGWHLYPALIEFERLGKSRRAVMSALRERGVGTQVHYIPVHRQPYYRRRSQSVSLPGADAYFGRCLSLPFFPTMRDHDVDRVVGALGAVAEGRG